MPGKTELSKTEILNTYQALLGLRAEVSGSQVESGGRAQAELEVRARRAVSGPGSHRDTSEQCPEHNAALGAAHSPRRA